MSTFSSISNNNDKFILRTKVTKLEDSKIESYLIRKQNKYTLPNNFLPKESFTLHKYVPTIKYNLKSQSEELQKLQVEISLVEEKIKVLEISKKMKLTKIDDLRKIIELIADEDCFECSFKNKFSNRKAAREAKNNSPNSNKKRSISDARAVISNTNVENSTFNTCNQEVLESSEPEGDKQTFNNNSNLFNCEENIHIHSYNLMHQNQCLLYWQEHLSQPKKIFKA